ncbi:hypothetical protein [Frankia gtarii]|uniref:hypothetical protein n=1 Tax=Frankia gtarii TaxID=2950102 RepID=UPI0021BECE2D|nr:hypothetical protein [Frankia gtarii]
MDLTRDGWPLAEQRAATATTRSWPGGPALADPDSWDVVAVRGILAVVLVSLHHRDSLSPTDAAWGSVLWHCDDAARVRSLVTAQLPHAAHAFRGSDDPVTRMWAWLTRSWDSPSSARWHGLRRGIARGSPEPAVDICTGWAAHIAAAEINRERGGHQIYDRVRIVGTPAAGRHGYVRGLAWHLDDTRQTVADGPLGYDVGLDDATGTAVIPADHLAVGTDGLSWPHTAREDSRS